MRRWCMCRRRSTCWGTARGETGGSLPAAGGRAARQAITVDITRHGQRLFYHAMSGTPADHALVVRVLKDYLKISDTL